MSMLVKPVLLACLASAALPAAAAPPRHIWQDRGQETANRNRQNGQNLPMRELERRIVPMMRGAQYLGFDFDPTTNIYTFKFLRNGAVIWVDVDGRSGRIVRR